MLWEHILTRCACVQFTVYEGTVPSYTVLVHFPIIISCREHDSHFVEMSKQFDFQVTVHRDKLLQ